MPCSTRARSTRFGGEPGTRIALGAHSAVARSPCIPPPANLKASIWAPAYTSGPAAGSLPQPPSSDRAPGAPIAAAAATASPLAWPLPRPPAPHALALPCSLARASAVPVRGTRPSQRGSSPGAAPHGAPGSGQGFAGSVAGRPPLAAGAPASAAAREEGGEGGKLPATPTPGARAPAAAARPPAAECERLRSEPAPAAASEHAQCRRGEPRSRPGPELQLRAGDPPLGSKAQLVGGPREDPMQGRGPWSKGLGQTMCGGQCEFRGLWEVCPLER